MWAACTLNSNWIIDEWSNLILKNSFSLVSIAQILPWLTTQTNFTYIITRTNSSKLCNRLQFMPQTFHSVENDYTLHYSTFAIVDKYCENIELGQRCCSNILSISIAFHLIGMLWSDDLKFELVPLCKNAEAKGKRNLVSKTKHVEFI